MTDRSIIELLDYSLHGTKPSTETLFDVQKFQGENDIKFDLTDYHLMVIACVELAKHSSKEVKEVYGKPMETMVSEIIDLSDVEAWEKSYGKEHSSNVG